MKYLISDNLQSLQMMKQLKLKVETLTTFHHLKTLKNMKSKKRHAWENTC